MKTYEKVLALTSIRLQDFDRASADLLFTIAEQVATYKLKRKQAIMNDSTVYKYLLNIYRTKPIEVFGVILLDNSHKVIDVVEITKGTVDAASIYPREVVKVILEGNARDVILFHNHPSGNIEPSHQDDRITDKLVKGLALLEIEVIDHIIFGASEYYSYASYGRL